MRIVVDLQACQVPAMRNRGIGRYTLSHIKALARCVGEHRLTLLLSNNFSDTIAALRVEFDGLVDLDEIRVFSTLGQLSDIGPGNRWRNDAALRVYQDFARSLDPDVFLQTCLFDAGSESVTGILAGTRAINSVTLYDLIPYQYPDRYLNDQFIRDWYLRKLQTLKNADLLLAISDSSRREAIDLLRLPADRLHTIGSAIDEHFRVREVSPPRAAQLRARYGLQGDFVMYTGGIDFRKNIEGLLLAYGQMPPAIRAQYQLAVVCNVDEASRQRLQREARAAGMEPGRLVLTGFVPEEDLVDLYNLARLFVFPSIHEGFGLPALEAMACGAPVLVSNRSSLPEVVGRADMLFDALDPADIAAAMARTLGNEARLAELRRHGLEQARRFSWERTAQATLGAFEEAYARRQHAEGARVALPARAVLAPATRPEPAAPLMVPHWMVPHWPQRRLAFVSPLPPCESGIADYSAELLPELARYYDIDLVTPQQRLSDPWAQANFACLTPEQFARQHRRYSRVLYQVGNSHFHSHMFGLLERRPGTLVLHDFFLSGMLNHLQQSLADPGVFDRALYRSHGYPALAMVREQGYPEVARRWPANFGVLAQAQGVIVHSEHSRELAERFYGRGFSADWACLPLLRAPKRLVDKALARSRLDIPQTARLTASFGFLTPTKLNDELLEAWLASQGNDPEAYLVFVGRNSVDERGQRLVRRIEASPAGKRVRITGFVTAEQYGLWLAAADLTVQLRGGSRGETSAAVLDCLVAGKPLIYNAHGSAAELPAEVGWRLPDSFAVAELADAIRQLLDDPERARRLGERARHYCARHAPASVAARYVEVIEYHAQHHPQARQRQLVQALRELPGHAAQPVRAHVELASAVAQNHAIGFQRTCFIDITALAEPLPAALREALCACLRTPLPYGRVELVRMADDGTYRVACERAARWLGLPAMGDQPLLTGPQDAWLHLDEACAPTVLTARLRHVGTLAGATLAAEGRAALERWLAACWAIGSRESDRADVARSA